jgi:polyhydroxybutyrate depolymerase
MSNGAFMTNRLGCERADVFAAIAPVAGTLGAGMPCQPSRPLPVLETHGTADPIVPFGGGPMRGRGGQSVIVSAPDQVARWRAGNGCQGPQSDETLPDARDGTTVHRLAGGCPAGAEVVFMRVDDGGHTWPGGLQYLPRFTIGNTSRAFDESDTSWQFFDAHGR